MKTTIKILFSIERIALIVTLIGVSFCRSTRADSFFNLQVGSGNSQTDKSLSVGTNNSLSYSSDAFSVGTANSGYFYNSAAIGSLNSILDTTNSVGVGKVNYIGSSSQSLVVGTNNDVIGLTNGAVIGEALQAYGPNGSLTIGQYNEVTGALFTVGNGYFIPETNIDPDIYVFHNALTLDEDGTMKFFGTSATSPTIVINPNVPEITINGQSVMSGGSGISGVENRSFGDSPLLSSAWKGAVAAGNSGYDKVVMGPVSSTYTGATIGGHNSALNAWANLNIAGQNLIFRSAGETERARITSTGNFGIGTTNPVAPLTVVGNVSLLGNGDTNSLQILGNGETPLRRGISLSADPQGAFNFYIHQWQGNSAFNFMNGHSNTNLMTLQASGRLGVGTSNPAGRLEVSSPDNGGQNIIITKSDSGNPNQNNGSLFFDNYHLHDTSRYSGVEAGAINFRFSQPTSGAIQNGAAIKGISEEQSSNLTPTALTFLTVPGAGTLVERMRIDSMGNVGLGTSTPKTSLQIGSADSLDIYDVSTQVRIFGKTVQSTTGETLLRLIRDHNSANYYPAVVDFKVAAYQAGGSGTNYNPATQLTFALKNASNFNEGANVDVMVLTSDGKVKIPKRQGDVQMGEFGNLNSGD